MSEPVNYLRWCFHGCRARWHRMAHEVQEGCSSAVSAVPWWRQTEEDSRRRKKSLKLMLMLQRSAFLHVVPMFLFSRFHPCWNCFGSNSGEATDLGTEGTFFTCGEELWWWSITVLLSDTFFFFTPPLAKWAQNDLINGQYLRPRYII